jgi:hypothetical protein
MHALKVMHTPSKGGMTQKWSNELAQRPRQMGLPLVPRKRKIQDEETSFG